MNREYSFHSIYNNLFSSLHFLFFPTTCVHCINPLRKFEKHLCTTCIIQLPRYKILPANNLNRLYELFSGRIELLNAISFLEFQNGGMAQSLMHEFKYNDNAELAQFLGNLFGKYVKERAPEIVIDYTCSVPLHPLKKKKRGYNQSDEIAKGFAEGFGCKFLPELAFRNVNTDSQTKKSREERQLNVKDVFSFNPKYEGLKGTFLLMDDVVTTGATLAECAKTLNQNGISELYIGTLAFAR